LSTRPLLGILSRTTSGSGRGRSSLARPRVPSPRVAGPAQHLERSIDATHRLGDDVVCGQVARRVRRSAEPGADVPVLGDPLGDDGGSPFPLGLGAGDTRLLTYPRRATVPAVFGAPGGVLRGPAARSPVWRSCMHGRNGVTHSQRGPCRGPWRVLRRSVRNRARRRVRRPGNGPEPGRCQRLRGGPQGP
jgi:hypothetical protein